MQIFNKPTFYIASENEQVNDDEANVSIVEDEEPVLQETKKIDDNKKKEIDEVLAILGYSDEEK